MRKMSSNEIRNTFLKYFEEKGHLIIDSAPLIPINDNTLLWINAGITPLKKYFDGSKVPPKPRLTSCQKCIRTNDIENVGVTARHHTFFEMLGNFSVGDYFRKEAIDFAIELLFDEKYFGFDKDKIYITVYTDDTETYNYWLEKGINEDHLVKLDSNFWEIGEGPCGPDTEIFYDRGVEYDPLNKGVALLHEEIENDRYIEIWNNVFSQYNAETGKNRNEYKELPNKNIDTGMGLERMASVIQGTKTNYETDLFMPIINKIEELSNTKYNYDMPFKVIADHIRALTVAISDGESFSNEGRGYVLRRLLRRAVRFGKKLGFTKPFMYQLVDTVVSIMKDNYPVLLNRASIVKENILKEEELFSKTLLSGEKILNEIMDQSTSKTISGEDAFKLYDTYGFPFELTLEYLEEKGYTVSREEFDKHMDIQKETARNARKSSDGMGIQDDLLLKYQDESIFVGYDNLSFDAKVIGLIKDGNFVEELSGEGYVVLDKTPFYAEMGGQVADTGEIVGNNVKATVLHVIKAPHKQHLHQVVVSGTLKVNDLVKANVDVNKRHNIMKNHSATHLLQKALKEVLDENIHQAGSRVDENTLRFDFVSTKPITDEDLIKIENLVNNKIQIGSKTIKEEMSLDAAKAKGSVALFDEKYESMVRVVTLGDSIELCGGTHVDSLADIKRFAIKSFESKGSNLYRIEATTDTNIERELGDAISPYNQEMIKLLEKAERILIEAAAKGIKLVFNFNINNDRPTMYKDILFNRNEVSNVRLQVKQLEKTYSDEKGRIALANLSGFTNLMTKINEVDCIVTKTEGYEISVLKQIVDKLVESMNSGFVFIANINDGSVNFIARSKNTNINCGALVKDASAKAKGNGGGSPIFAQGGGTDISLVDTILDDIKKGI